MFLEMVRGARLRAASRRHETAKRVTEDHASNQRIMRRFERTQEQWSLLRDSFCLFDFLESSTPGLYPRVRRSGPRLRVKP
jgi:hypothetical protein